MTANLSRNEAELAELYGLKVLLACLLAAYLSERPDKHGAAAELSELAANSIDDFHLAATEPASLERIREAMHERVSRMIASAANPVQVPPSRPDKSKS